MRTVRVLGGVVAIACIGSCAGDEAAAGADAGPVEGAELDLRVPDMAPDPAFIDFPGAEAVIEPGGDKMICVHLHYDGEEIAFSDAQAIQGEKYGHHAIILGAKEPLPAGTVEDCSDAGDMSKYDAFALPAAMPDGYGVLLEKGRSIVLQSHYVNTGKVPIRVRDYVRLKKVDVASVTTWAAMFATNTVNLKLPKKKTEVVSFDCVISQDGELVLLGGHMHEWGKKIELLHGPDVDHLETLHEVDPWRPEYRDIPPIDLLWNNPIPVKKGDIFRTVCTYDNTEDEDLIFPHEMCSSFGYLRGTKTVEICNLGAE